MKKVHKIIGIGSGLTVGALLIATAFAQTTPAQPQPNQFKPIVPVVQSNPVGTNTVQPVAVAQAQATDTASNGANGLKTQSNLPAQTINSNTDAGQATLAGTNVAPPGDGNVYEREVTPLLRNISKAKAQLELKKLQAESEKVDAEIMKAQQDKSGGGNNSGKFINAQDLSNSPINSPVQPTFNNGPVAFNPTALSSSNIPTGSMATSSSDIRVLMTFGYDNDLYAKISSGNQGGYVVKKGDILPDGKVVVSVQPNFIEVKNAPKSRSKYKVEKIYVTGPAPVGPNGQPLVSSGSAGGASSSSIAPVGPLSMPGMISSGANIQMGGNNQNTQTGERPNKLVITPLQ